MPVYRKRSKFTGNDENKIHCASCGFICDSKRDVMGGLKSPGSANHRDYALQTGIKYRAGIGPRPVPTLDVMLHYQVALKLSAGGQLVPVMHHHKTNPTSGCPFCGSLNYRGDY
jgi:hypothetical protein